MTHRSSLTLGRRFALALVPVSLLAVGGLWLLSYFVFEPEYEERCHEQLQLRLEARALPLVARWSAMAEALGGFANRASRSDLDPAQWPEASRTFLRVWPEVQEIFLIDAIEGRVARHAVRGRSLGTAVPDSMLQDVLQDFERIASLRGKRVIDPVACIHPFAGRGRAWLARPSRDQELVLLALLRPGVGDAHLESMESDDGARAAIVDAHGHLLTLGDAAPIHEADAFRNSLRAPGPLTSTAQVTDHVGHAWFTSLHADPQLGLAVAVSTPRSVVYADYARWQRMALALIAIVLLAGAFFLYRMSRRVRIPLESLADTMEIVARGDLTQRMPVEGQAEFAAIARAFNTMISDLHTTHAAMRSQSERLAKALREVEDVEAMKDSFLALVSHEVRTPLTSIMGGVEFLRDEFADERTEIECEFIEIVYDSARRLSGFMNDAILMASLQSSRSQTSFEIFSLTGLVKSKVEALEAYCAKQKIVIENRVELQREFFVLGDWTLMQVALEKVLHNAVRHNHADGRVVVELVERVLEDPDGDLRRLMIAKSVDMPEGTFAWQALRVFNTGPVIAGEKIDQLFERFELTHDISNHQRGSGLSLPIANYVLGFHRGCIEVRRVGETGMAFYLVLPGRVGVDTRQPITDMPENVDETVAAAHLVQAAGHDVEALERQIEAAERAEAEAEDTVEAEDAAIDRAQHDLEEVLVGDDPDVETP